MKSHKEESNIPRSMGQHEQGASSNPPFPYDEPLRALYNENGQGPSFEDLQEFEKDPREMIVLELLFEKLKKVLKYILILLKM